MKLGTQTVVDIVLLFFAPPTSKYQFTAILSGVIVEFWVDLTTKSHKDFVELSEHIKEILQSRFPSPLMTHLYMRFVC